MESIVVKTYIHAPIEHVWGAISDHEGYARFKGIDFARVVKEGVREGRTLQQTHGAPNRPR